VRSTSSPHMISPLAVPSSLEAPTIFPGTGDPESDLADEANDRGGVEATDIDENDSEGESEGTRCCDTFCGAVSKIRCTTWQ
jgi:hypothetical protein